MGAACVAALVLSLLGVLIQPSHAQELRPTPPNPSLSISAQRRSARQFDGRFRGLCPAPELSNGDAEGGYRLIRSDGREVPYVVTSDAGESKDRRHSGQLVDTRHEGDQTLWIVDLGSIRRFESLDLNIPQIQFRRRVTVEAAEQQNGPYHVIARDVGIFDLPWQNAPGWTAALHHHGSLCRKPARPLSALPNQQSLARFCSVRCRYKALLPSLTESSGI